MGEKRAYKPGKPGGGRKKLKPEYDARKNLKEQMESAVALYEEKCSLQDIADALALNPIKVRKLLITAGVYESEVAKKVQDTFEEYRETQDYKTSILSTANTLQLSKASVTSYLPYKKGVYFPSTTDKEKISVGAERQRRYRAMKRWRTDPTEENFWGVVLAHAGVKLKTYSGLPFSYEIKKGRNGEYTKELWIDRRENSKSLAWSSVLLTLKNIKGNVVFPGMISYIMMDANNLKKINDSLGHNKGDEFVIILKNKTAEETEEIIRQVRAEIEFADEQSDIPISVAMGYAWTDAEEKNLPELIHCADEKMYKDKKRIKENTPSA